MRTTAARITLVCAAALLLAALDLAVNGSWRVTIVLAVGAVLGLGYRAVVRRRRGRSGTGPKGGSPT